MWRVICYLITCNLQITSDIEWFLLVVRSMLPCKTITSIFCYQLYKSFIFLHVTGGQPVGKGMNTVSHKVAINNNCYLLFNLYQKSFGRNPPYHICVYIAVNRQGLDIKVAAQVRFVRSPPWRITLLLFVTLPSGGRVVTMVTFWRCHRSQPFHLFILSWEWFLLLILPSLNLFYMIMSMITEL